MNFRPMVPEGSGEFIKGDAIGPGRPLWFALIFLSPKARSLLDLVDMHVFSIAAEDEF